MTTCIGAACLVLGKTLQVLSERFDRISATQQMPAGGGQYGRLERSNDQEIDEEQPTSGENVSSSRGTHVFELVEKGRWTEAWAWIDNRPGCVYEQERERKWTPLHAICWFVRSRKCNERDVRGAVAVARLILECSHHRTEPTTCLHPSSDFLAEEVEYSRAVHSSVLTVQNKFGRTVLHMLCDFDYSAGPGTTELVRLVLESTADYGISMEGAKTGSIRKRQRDGKPLPTVYDLLSCQDTDGYNPMHNCCAHEIQPEVMDLMLDACQVYCTSMRVQGRSEWDVQNQADPTLASVYGWEKHPICARDQDRDETPAQIACYMGMEPHLLRRLLIQPDRIVSAVAMLPMKENAWTPIDNFHTPIDDLIDWCFDYCHGLNAQEVDPGPLEEHMIGDIADAVWSRIEVIIEAVVYGQSKNYEESPTLHWAASIHTFPAIVLRMACNRFSSCGSRDLLLRDRLGRTPLHHAANPLCWNNPYFSNCFDTMKETGDFDELSRWESKMEARTPIEYLIQQCPEALYLRSCDGALPLHTALMCKRTKMKDIEVMIDAAPETLTQKDGQGLLPFMVAASNHHLTISFKLLLLDPRLVQACA